LRKHARQLAHALADAHGLKRGLGTESIARYGPQPRTLEEFRSRRPAAGGFAATPPAARSHFSLHKSSLAAAPFWVWRILRTYQAGEAFPVEVSGHRIAKELTYEAQLYAEEVGGRFVPIWDEMPIAAYLRTQQEKRKRAKRRLANVPFRARKSLKVKAPLVAYLRDGNVIGGGFALTAKQRVAPRTRKHLQELGYPAHGTHVMSEGENASESESSSSD